MKTINLKKYYYPICKKVGLICCYEKQILSGEKVV